MYRLACDSDNLDALVHTPIILTYADLIPDRAHLDDLRDRFPGSLVKLINRGLGDPLGVATACHILDEETGALTIDQAVSLTKQMIADGADFPTVYANRTTMPIVIQKLSGIPGWWKWWATLDGTMRIATNPNDMVQFAGTGMTGGGYDLSIVYQNAWHPQPGL